MTATPPLGLPRNKLQSRIAETPDILYPGKLADKSDSCLLVNQCSIRKSIENLFNKSVTYGILVELNPRIL